MTKDQIIDELWERSGHGTQREDVVAAFEAGVHAEREKHRYEIPAEILKSQLLQARVSVERLRRLLIAITSLEDPAPTEIHGKTYVFQNPMAAEVLRELSASIRAAREALPEIGFKEATDIQAAFDAGVAAEREACAQLCEQWNASHPERLAEAIRARGKP